MSTLTASRWLPLAPIAVAALAFLAAGARCQGLLANTALVAVGTLVVALPAGGLLGLLIHKLRLPGQAAAAVAVLTLLFLPLHLCAAAWRAGFGTLGWYTQQAADGGVANPLLEGFAGVIWIHAAAAIAWVAVIVGAALRSVDRQLEEDALLAMPAWRVLLTVSLRAAAPAFVVAAGWIAITVAHEMTVTDLFQVRTFAEEVYTQHALGLFDPTQLDDPDQRLQQRQLFAGLAVVWGLAVAVLWSARGLIDRVSDGMARDAWRWDPAPRAPAVLALLLMVVVLAGVPIGNLLYKAGGNAVREGDAWRQEWSLSKAVTRVGRAPVEHRRQLWQSAKLGLGVACGATLAGALVAWRLARGGVEQLAWLAAIALALTTPGPLIGIGAIDLFNRPLDSPLWPLSWLYDHTLAVVWAVQMVRATPVVAILLWPVWQGLPAGLVESARLEGGGPIAGLLAAARSRWGAVTAAWLAALAVSFGELSASLLVIPPGPQTVTIELFNLLHAGVDDRVAAISLVMIALLAVATWLVARLWSRAPE